MKRMDSGRRMPGGKGVYVVLPAFWVALVLSGVATGSPGVATAPQDKTPITSPEVKTTYRIAEFLPQGRVSGVEAVQVRFSGPATTFGDTDATPPVVLTCEGPAPEGQGRWLDDSRWTYVFDRSLPAGVRCVAAPEPSFRSLNGQALPGELRYTFDTGTPAVTDMRPYHGATIDEEQVFLLRFNGPVDAAQVAAHSHCAVEGLGEKIPLQLVGEEHRAALLEAAYLPQPDDPAALALLQCARVLPPEAKFRLEIGPGIRAVGQSKELESSQQAQVLEYEVRAPFTATISCTRERAGRPCLPVTPISLNFSAPVPRAALTQVHMTAGDTEFQPEQQQDEDAFITQLTFPGPFPPDAVLTLSLPEGLQDDAGRKLENAERFPLTVEVADYPPLARFASGTFGVIERFAHAKPGSGSEEPAAVPVTLRHIETDATLRGMSWSAGQVSSLRSVDDAEVLAWYARVQRLEAGRWSRTEIQDILAGRAPRYNPADQETRIDVRSVPVLKGQPAVQRLSLPAGTADAPRPFEVVGVPLEEPGFHVLEIESPRLGDALLEDRGAMYVRTGVLLTNLSVHVKQGRDDLLVWVTSLADARMVANADITVRDCEGRQLARGRSNAQGIWHHLASIGGSQRYCEATGLSGLFVSARIPADHPQAHGKADYAFVMSDWDRGIENWRFNVPTASNVKPDRLAHTVFDRSLFRAGEIVSMKHYLREETRDGLQTPVDTLPDRLIIEHEGSSQRHEFPLAWEATASGGLAAVNEFEIPESAHWGSYAVRLTDSNHAWYGSSRFRVEEFRLPLLEGRLSVTAQGAGERPGILVAPGQLAVDMQLGWISGGAASGQKVSLSAVAEERGVHMKGYDDYRFQPPPGLREEQADTGDQEDDDAGPRRRLFLDSHQFTLNSDGMATVEVETLPATDRPQRFVFEADFSDPNGEIQTLSQSVDVWPSAVQAGLKTTSWNRTGQDVPVSLISLGTDAQPRAGVVMRLLAVERKMYTVRKRMVGGFYRYDTHTERNAIGTLCTGETDDQGRLECNARFDQAGSFELVALAEDEAGRVSRAYTSIWVSGDGESWFGGADDDRIDLIPAKREWAVGEEAEFQVRMPFRDAVALVSVEREGVLWAQQVKLDGKNPVIRVPVDAAWGPNVYVSALVLRGRLYELPWKSFFEWGWRHPQSWLQAWRENPGDIQVSSTVDLAKPAFRLGVTELRVSGQADRLQVEVLPERDVLQVREETRARVKVSLPDGRPAAHGSIAFAVVDEALLELAPNPSWAIYEAMHPRRSLGVRTATSQLEVVGRRHYGRKAVAAGGGGGNLPTRQLFDTLLSWQPLVQLDANGEAEVSFRMNDALSRFRLVALADHGASYFGSASAAVVTRQDLQLVSGLPPVVREGDRYQAVATVRNGTDQEREITVNATYEVEEEGRNLPVRRITLAPGASGSVLWEILAPELPWPVETAELKWRLEASGVDIADRLAITQRIEPRLPVATVQASLLGLSAGESAEVPVRAPVGALQRSNGAAHGGIALDVSTSLAGSLEGVRDWWRAYPYTCLEQSASQAVALNDTERWGKVVGRLSTHIDSDGLLRYFPGTGPGSEILTAYLVSMVDEAKRLGLELGIPAEVLRRMLDGLQAYAQGRLTRETPASGVSLDSRRLMAMEALARHGRARPEILASLSGSPEHWPTPTVVDWLSVLLRMPAGLARDADIAQARSILVSRMTVSGTAMVFSDSSLNAAPFMMASRATSQAKLMLMVMDHPQWQQDLPLMAQGLVALQRQGAWAMTTENLLGSLALTAYAQRFEAEAASGTLQATLADEQTAIHLPAPGDTVTQRLAWPQAEAALQLSHDGRGRAWVGLRAQAKLAVTEAQGTGYRVEKRVVPVQRSRQDVWSRGDVYRVEIDIHSRDSATWVVLNDPVPAGATILGSGLGRDASILQPIAEDLYSPAFVERAATGYRAYFDYLPAGRVRVAYTVRLSAEGQFGLPPTRVEALYRPDLYGVHPNLEGMRVERGVFDDAGRP